MSTPDDDDAPLTLEEACRVIFAGGIKPATLLAEARRGKLVIERIGRRNFVTRAGIKAMREACRVGPKHLASGVFSPPVSSSPVAEQASAALDAALESLRTPRKPSRRKATTSRNR